MNSAAFVFYCFFLVSWFLRLTVRLPVLGLLRLDLLLILGMAILIILKPSGTTWGEKGSHTGSVLKLLILYVMITIPFVEWPGSVFRRGIEGFTKAVVFFYFSVYLINSERRLKVFMGVFLTCQCLRIVEPYYLHMTTGYWGSQAHLVNWEFMHRLSGAPHDVVNPNGLAFLIVTVIPFLHYLSRHSKKYRVVYWILLPILIHAMVLTGSRSGFVCLFVVLAGIVFKSKRKILLGGLVLVGTLIVFTQMTSLQKDRYSSIINADTQNAGTMKGRWDGLVLNLKIAARRPLFGHGLGTSREASFNFGGSGQIAHNLIAEVAMELGFLGLFIYFIFLQSIIRNFAEARKMLQTKGQNFTPFIRDFVPAMHVWLFMNLVSSIGSYGLSTYEWYLFGGFSVILHRLVVLEPRSDKIVRADSSWGPSAVDTSGRRSPA